MTVSTETVRMAKSRPRKNQSERSDLPCHIIILNIYMEEFDINVEIKILEALYNHYRKLYHRVRFLCCSSESKRLKERKFFLKFILRKQKGLKNIVMQ